MFERFSNDGRRVLVGAQEHAKQVGADHIGTMHLLLGVLDANPELVEAVVAPGTMVAEVRESLTGIASDEPTSGGVPPTVGGKGIPFSIPSKTALELALRTALRLDHKTIEVGHLLLGVIAADGSIGGRVLRYHGSDAALVASLEERLREAYRGLRLRTADLEATEQRFWTPGGKRAMFLARQLSENEPLSTVVLLRALIKEGNGMAARALDHLGVTEAALNDALASLDVASTSDAPASTEVRVIVGGEEARVQVDLGDDPDVAERVREAIASGRFQQAFRDVLRRERGGPEDQPADDPGPQDEPEG